MTGPSPQKRRDAARSGHALPDGSFPINTIDDLKKAIQAVGRASDSDRARRHVIKRARALGRTDLLPATWNASRKSETSSVAVVAAPAPASPSRVQVLADLRAKAVRHNALTAAGRYVDLAPLLAVYRRGTEAWTPDRAAGMSAHECGHARVNAYLCALRRENLSADVRDRDLMPRR